MLPPGVMLIPRSVSLFPFMSPPTAVESACVDDFEGHIIVACEINDFAIGISISVGAESALAEDV